jgi:hypothetical protein
VVTLHKKLAATFEQPPVGATRSQRTEFGRIEIWTRALHGCAAGLVNFWLSCMFGGMASHSSVTDGQLIADGVLQAACMCESCRQAWRTLMASGLGVQPEGHVFSQFDGTQKV